MPTGSRTVFRMFPFKLKTAATARVISQRFEQLREPFVLGPGGALCRVDFKVPAVIDFNRMDGWENPIPVENGQFFVSTACTWQVGSRACLEGIGMNREMVLITSCLFLVFFIGCQATPQKSPLGPGNPPRLASYTPEICLDTNTGLMWRIAEIDKYFGSRRHWQAAMSPIFRPAALMTGVFCSNLLCGGLPVEHV